MLSCRSSFLSVSLKPVVQQVALAALILALPVTGGLSDLAAQETSLQSLSDRLSRLQREVSDLQRQVATGGGAGTSAGAPTAVSDAPLPPDQAGRLNLRLSRQEEQLRGMTGQMEELNHRLNLLSQRLEDVVADIDRRLSGGQVPVAQSGGTSGQALTTGTSTAGTRQPGTAAASAAVTGGADDGKTKVLGYISQGTAAPVESAPVASQPLTTATVDTQTVTTGTASAATAEDAYQQAFSSLRQANWSKAEGELVGFLNAYPTHSLAGNAQYWLGETYYVRGDFGTAATIFAEGFEKYPDGGKAPDNLLKLGMALGNLDRKQDACDTFLALQQRYADAPASLLTRSKRERQRLGC
ncbi:tol-pal system protein YbgF [Rhodovibrionaceae bacterium A322]